MINALRRGPHDRAIFRIAIPALGALAAEPIVSLIDTAFVGRLGAVALAAVAIAGAVYTAAFAIFNFLEYAVTPFVAQSIGSGDRDAAGRFTIAAYVVSAVVGVLAGIGLFVFGTELLGVFGAEPAVLAEATVYLEIRSLGVPALLIILVGHGAFRGYQDTRTPLSVTLGLNLVNLVLDPLLIFSLGWGVAGAAWATVAAQWFGAIWFSVLFFWTRRRDLGISLGRFDWTALGPLFKAGGAMIVRNIALLGALTAATIVAARIGTAEVAAHQIAIRLWIFLALVLDALAIAGQALVGKELGRNREDTARAVSNRLALLGTVFGVLLSVLLTILSPWLGLWFTADNAVLAAFASILPFVILMQPLNGLVFVWDGVIIGAASFRYFAWSTAAAAVSMIGSLIVVAATGAELVGVWTSVMILMVVRAIALWWWYSRRFASAGRDPSPSSQAT